MEVRLYKTTSPRKKLVKELTDGITLTGNLRAQSSVMSPVLQIQDTQAIGYNYCYIPDFGRWYYINNINALRSNLFELSLGIDVLMTYAEAIRGNSAIIDKVQAQGTAYTYINDGSFVNTNRMTQSIINFSAGFNDSGEFILITAGGME
nr:MAG TPA: major tail protein [Caudoviricetes sp.]